METQGRQSGGVLQRILTCHFLAKHTSGALILCLSTEFAVWAEGDEYNGEKIEERSERGSGDGGECVGEQIGLEMRGRGGG